MPLYDYHCPACGHRFEALVRGGTRPACPQCGGTALEKAVSRISPAGKIEAIRMSNRRAAAREGHLSNFSPAEQKKLLRG
jgi:putative FmdB family regulatory protein